MYKLSKLSLLGTVTSASHLERQSRPSRSSNAFLYASTLQAVSHRGASTELMHGVPNAIDSNRSSSIAVDAACRAEGVINCAIVESVAGELRLAPGWCQKLEVFLLRRCCRNPDDTQGVQLYRARIHVLWGHLGEGGLDEAEADFIGEAAVAAAVGEGELFAVDCRHYYSNHDSCFRL